MADVFSFSSIINQDRSISSKMAAIVLTSDGHRTSHIPAGTGSCPLTHLGII